MDSEAVTGEQERAQKPQKHRELMMFQSRNNKFMKSIDVFKSLTGLMTSQEKLKKGFLVKEFSTRNQNGTLKQMRCKRRNIQSDLLKS